jgi:hypothetical protein
MKVAELVMIRNVTGTLRFLYLPSSVFAGGFVPLYAMVTNVNSLMIHPGCLPLT